MGYFLSLAMMAVCFGVSFTSYQAGDSTDALQKGFCGTALLIATLAYLFIDRARKGKSKDPLLGWILANRNMLAVGINLRYGYENDPIGKETLLVRYYWVFGPVELPGKWHIRGSISSELHGTFSMLFNLLFGWWDIPWGPVRNIKILYTNLFGRRKIKVADVLSGAYPVEFY
ncbi:MAG: hypothetical protein RKO25_08735 [Candidatus Contendobacter sp.]|nr:hypothetical protein [Candidatus Contendobacter sp.]